MVKAILSDKWKIDLDEESKVTLIWKTNILQQDNPSTIQSEWHGKKSSTKRIGHIIIWYFYCISLLENQTIISIIYHPTKEFVADYFSKL